MSLFKGRVHTKEIEKKPVEIKGDEKEPWVQELLEKSAPSAALTGLEPKNWAEKSHLKTDLRLEKVGTDYMVTGTFEATVPTTCSRCGDLYTAERGGDFRVFLVPTDPRAKSQDYSDDPDYVMLNADEVNVSDLVSEQLVVQEPVAECPNRRDYGTCQLCGKNPSFVPGQAAQNEATSPFAKLKTLKL